MPCISRQPMKDYHFSNAGTAVASITTERRFRKETTMNLLLALPALIVVGLMALGLMFLFVIACDRV